MQFFTLNNFKNKLSTYRIHDCMGHTVLNTHKSILTLFIRFNQEHANRTGDKERACVAAQIIPERRRQKGRVPSGLTCLKRGRVELVLACPPKGTRKELLVWKVPLPERWALVLLGSGKTDLIYACQPNTPLACPLPRFVACIRVKSRF